MKKKTFILFFICTNLLFIAAQIKKQSRLVQLSYTQQRHEKELKKLELQKQTLANQLHELHNLKDIKIYAQEHLNMKPLKVTDVQKVQKT